MEELDFDNMTDEQVDEILNNIQTGKYNDVQGGSDESENDSAEQNKDVITDDEDTDGSDSEADETETNDGGDGDGQETEDSEEDDGQENSPVEKDDEGNDVDISTTDEADADQITGTAEIDAAEYERYKKFYDKLTTAEFTANGKKVKAFTDPDKILQSQQMSYGFGPKMAAIKEYRPFLTTLKERGFLENPEKFNLAMDLLDGDQEALKKHMQTLNVDPIDLDMDSVSYSSKNHLSSKESIVLEDTLELAKNYGVEEKLRATIGKEWDQDSFNEFLTVPEVRQDLLEHMATGAFDIVQDRIAEMKVLDLTGAFSSMKATDQYRQAVQSLTAEATRINQSQQQPQAQEARAKTVAQRPTSDKAAELAKKQEAEYKRNLEAKNLEAEAARKKAVSVSKKKVSTTTKTSFDPLALEGKEFDAYVESLIRA